MIHAPMDLEDQDILAMLPPRTLGIPLHPSQVDFLTTDVERYVRDVVESQPLIPEAEIVLEPLLLALYVRNVTPPVPMGVLAQVLEEDIDVKLVNSWAKEYASLMPRLLKTLNGSNFPLVMPHVLRNAMDKEKAMATMPLGWGTSDPPLHAKCTRLLLASGFLEFLLPPYKTLPKALRSRICRAWKATCDAMHWENHQPHSDIAAENRRA